MAKHTQTIQTFEQNFKETMFWHGSKIFLKPIFYNDLSLDFLHPAYLKIFKKDMIFRRGSRAPETSNMERFVIIVNGFHPLTIITKRSFLDVAAGLDPRLIFPNSMKIPALLQFTQWVYLKLPPLRFSI